MPHLALVIRDYNEALAFYVGKLGFELVEDTYRPRRTSAGSPSARPARAADATTILLPSARFPTMLRIAGTLGGSARATTPERATRIGDQTGGRVAFFLATDDFAHDNARFTTAGAEWFA